MAIFKKLKSFKKGGIHPNPMKLTADRPVEPTKAPSQVRILLSQHIGAPAKCIVKVGDSVEVGQMIGEAAGFVSAPVHTPIAGTVKKIELVRDGQGLWKEAVLIEAPKPAESAEGEENRPHGEKFIDFDESSPVRTEEEIAALTPKEIIDIVGNAGIVGLGGASFPTRVKLSIPPGKSADLFLINGAECEPFLTCDDALMRRYPRQILDGVEYLMKASGTKKAVIGIEANKPQAIKKLTEAAKDYPEISVVPLKTAYPQGSEKQLIYALCGRVVPAGGLPVDAGVIVDNVATAFAVERAVRYGEPLMKRVATVTGVGVEKPGNYIVATGVSASDLISVAGGIPENTGKIISGGPMMGRAMSAIDSPMAKANGGILIVPEKASLRAVATACLRCGCCVDACPMSLEPYLLQTFGEFSKDYEARDNGALNCLECGSCSYVCPAHRPLLDYIRLSRQRIRNLPKE